MAVYDSYMQTGMGQSFGAATGTGTAQYSHAASRRRYSAAERNGRVVQERTDVNGKNAYALEATHVVGSGNHARTYLHRAKNGEFIELPLSWYSEGNQWAMSPGFDAAAPPDFTRIVDERCLFCHNAYPAADGKIGNGIDCQRCHGPGARHVELASGGKSKEELAAAIVNPARLAADRQMDVCLQCHLETTSAALPAAVRRFGRPAHSFRPGERLADYAVYFDDARADKFEVVNQGYRLRQSACFLQSKGKMTCTTCHNPHEALRGTAATERHRAQCLSCHATPSAAQHPKPQTMDCAGCHMPKRKAEDAVHVVMTDHKIQRRLTPPVSHRAQQQTPRLLEPAADGEAYLGVALIAGHSDIKGGVERLERLRTGLPAGALAVLGEGYVALGRHSEGVEALTQALAKESQLPRARYNLTQAYEGLGRLIEARAEYEKHGTAVFPEMLYGYGNLLRRMGDAAGAEARYAAAIDERPTYAEAHGNLGALLIDSGRAAEGRRALEEAIRIDPSLGDAHNNLGRVLAAQGALAEAIAELRIAVRLQPENARARYNLARVLQETNAMAAAVAEYREALRIDPQFAEAHLGMGQALGDMGRIDAAIVEFRETLRLQPGNAEARRNLEMATGGGR